MKNFLLKLVLINTVMFFLSQKDTFGQTYTHFPDLSAKWSEETKTIANHIGKNINYEYHGSLYTLGNDTIINSTKYTLVGFQNTWSISPSPYSHDEVVNSSIILPGEIFGAIREDTSKKVWFKNFYSNSNSFNFYNSLKDLPADAEIIIYDFNLLVNDTLTFGAKSGGHSPKISYIDSIKLNDNIFHKRFHLSYLYFHAYLEHTWIEGIGSSYGLFGNYSIPILGENSYQGNWLNCFTANGQSIYKNETMNDPIYKIQCDSTYYFGINPSSKLFPNPASDILNFKFMYGGNYKVEIINILGETLTSIVCNLTLNQIDVSHLSSGIYFVRLMESTELKSVHKFVKL